MLWSPDAKNWLIGKNPGSGKAWRQEEKGMTVDEMVARHHRLSGHKFEQVLGAGDREARRAAVYGVAKSRTQLSSWSECIHEYTNVYDKSLIHYNLQLQSCALVYDLEESGRERERERERENEFQLKCMLGKPLKTCTWKSRQSPNLQINIWELPLWNYRSFLFFPPSVAYHQVCDLGHACFSLCSPPAVYHLNTLNNLLYPKCVMFLWHITWNELHIFLPYHNS